jgi:hypothetical protein
VDNVVCVLAADFGCVLRRAWRDVCVLICSKQCSALILFWNFFRLQLQIIFSRNRRVAMRLRPLCNTRLK